MQHGIDAAMTPLERVDPGSLGIIRKRIEHRAGYVIVNPVDWTRVASARIRFQVVNPHAAGSPVPQARMPAVDPDVAPALRRSREMYGDDEQSLRRNGRRRLRETCCRH